MPNVHVVRISNASPQDLGASAPGATGQAADAGHVHAHGNQSGGTLHAIAIAGVLAGFISAADQAKLDGIADGAVAISGTDNRLVRVDGTTGIQDSPVTLDDLGNLSGVADLTTSGLVTAGNGLTVSAGTVSLPDNQISYAEMQDVSAEARILGRAVGAGAGDPTELTAAQVAAILDASPIYIRADGTTTGATSQAQAFTSGITSDGIVTIGGARLDLTAASTEIRIGTGAGSPLVRKGKSDAGTFSENYYSGGIAATNLRWQQLFSGGENIQWARYAIDGSPVDTPFSLDWATGHVTLANQLNGTSAVFSSNVTGGAFISNGTIAMDKTDAATINLAWRVSGTARWFVNFDANENLNWFRRDVSGNPVDTPLSLDWSNGRATFANLLNANGGFASGADSTINGDLSVGTTSAAPTGARLYVVDSSGGRIMATTSETNAQRKFARFGVPHYTNAEEPFDGIYLDADSASNTVRIGGGSGAGNTATQVSIYTAANNTTTTGTEVLRATTSALTGFTPWTTSGALSVLTGGSGNAILVGDSSSTNTTIGRATAASGNGGQLTLFGAPTSGLNQAGGACVVIGGTGNGSGTGGSGQTLGGAGGPTGAGGIALVQGGTGGASGGAGGAVTVRGGTGGTASGAGGAVTVQGGLPIDGDGGSVTIQARDGATTSATARAGGSVSISAGQGASGGAAGTVTIATNGTTRVTVGSSGLVTLTNGLTAGGNVTGVNLIASTGVVISAAQATAPTPTAGFGSFYTRSSDGAPMHAYGATPVVTELAAAFSWEIPLTVAGVIRSASNYGIPLGDGTGTAVAQIGNNSTSLVPVIVFAAGSTTAACWEGVVPRNYQGGDLVVTLWLSGDGAASAAADFDVALERQTGGDSIAASSFAAAVSTTNDTISGTAGAIIAATATISGASLDGIAAGDPIRIRVRRVGPDSYTPGIVGMHRGLVREAA